MRVPPCYFLVVLLLVWVAKGLPAPREASDPELEDEDAVVAELARRLHPLEGYDSNQRRLEEFESRQKMRSDLEESRLEAAESQHGCGGGCSKGGFRSKATEDLEAEYMRDLQPRPIFGLLNEILETARSGYKIDRPRPHLIF